MRYRKLADQMVADIEKGLLSHGQKMPSLRTFRRQFDVSMTTAINCYRHLEERGWIVARPQSGFYVSLPQGCAGEPQSPFFLSKATSVQLKKNDAARVNGLLYSGPFGVSQLSPSQIPSTALRRCLKRGLVRASESLSQYPEPQGSGVFRQALVAHHAARGFAFSARDAVTTGGCIDAVRLALEVTTEVGDTVAISSPCFSGLLALLAALSRRVIEIPCLDGGIDLQQLEQHMKNGDIAAALFSATHMNPHGSCLPVAQKKQLADMASRYRVPVIEDDIYAELGYSAATPLPVKHWDSDGYVLWCSSVSKTLAPSLRLGWCLPGRYRDGYVQRAQSENLGRNSIVEAGIADFFLSGQYQKHLRQLRQLLVTNKGAYRLLLSERLPPGSAVSHPQGGMVLWVQVPGLRISEFKKASEAAGLDIRTGDEFSTLAHYNDCFRINFSWSLADMHDENRTVEICLHQLLDLVSACSA